MKPTNVVVSNRGYVVLPASLRRKMNIRAGTRMLLSAEEDRIILQPVHSFTDELTGLTAGAFGRTPEEVATFLDGERKER